MGSTASHWDEAYSDGDTTRGWYQPAATMSMDLLREADIPDTAAIVDIGAGASVFVDDLLEAGFTDVTLLDHSPVGLQITRQRLDSRASGVAWVVADLRDWQPDRRFDVWHDRAVLHFLLDAEDRDYYRQTLLAATHPGSIIILGVFGPEGPQMCAGLPVRRHTIDDVRRLLGPDFTVVTTRIVDHVRPDGETQQYLWTLARR